MDQQNKQIITDNQYNDGRQSDYIINRIMGIVSQNTKNRRNNRITEIEEKTGLRE